MKELFWSLCILFVIGTGAQAQTKSKKVQTKKALETISSTKVSNTTITFAPAVSLNSTANYSAKANSSILHYPQAVFTISDPILTALDQRAKGANIRFNNSGIVDIPKGAYGFANGHITLSTTGAVTSGTQTGSGAVGTGTSLATFGSIGTSMNVNGKSSDAGISMWGNARNIMIDGRKSSRD